MSKERLEEITNSVGILLSGDRHVLLRREHYEWLIEQVERVQELEVWYHSYHKEAKLNNILKIQNKRYREALEWYSENSPHGNIADEALEGESDA